MICDKCIDKEICDGRCFYYKERMEVKEGVIIVVNGGQVRDDKMDVVTSESEVGDDKERFNREQIR